MRRVTALHSLLFVLRDFTAGVPARANGMRRVRVLLWPIMLASACGVHPNAALSYRARNAHTPKEHATVAEAYRERARDLRQESVQHGALAEWWANLAGGKTPATGTGRYEEAEHCRRLAANLAAAATEADALAEAHDRLAGQGTSR